MDKPYSPACERNRDPILARLQAAFGDRPLRVLEVGAGTGQHGAYFSAAQPQWHWQSTDVAAHLPGISKWQREAQRPNLPPPRLLDVTRPADWQPLAQEPWDLVYSANTLHIMPWTAVQAFFSHLPQLAPLSAGLVIYGAFLRDDAPTAPSNLAFDADLRARDPQMGLRRLAAVQALAEAAGFGEPTVTAMPANNLLLQWGPSSGGEATGAQHS